MANLIITQFDKGLLLTPSEDSLPEGFLRSNRGMHPLSLTTFRSRFGCSQLFDTNAHSITYFNDLWHFGTSTIFYRNNVSIKTGLNGNRLSMIAMPPTAGVADYLFVAGGGTLFKVTQAGVVSNWGFAAPASAPTAAFISTDYTSIRTAAFQWDLSGSGTQEYYVTSDNDANPATPGVDPSLPNPTHVIIPLEEEVQRGIIGSLQGQAVFDGEREFAYGDNDGLGFSTIYIRIFQDLVFDPDGLAVDGIRYTTLTSVLTKTNFSTSTYKYKITYKNSVTGARSNPSSEVSLALSYPGRIQLSAIPDGSAVDSQIDKCEIWRTVMDGSAFFYLDEINAGVATYIDDGSVTLSSIELPTDNIQPYSYLSDCAFYNNSVFWITRTQSNEKGRIYYSPVGRMEAVEGYLIATTDSNPLQKLFTFQGQLGVIAQEGIYLISGNNPYYVREVSGCSGTNYPFSVAVTSYGVCYIASDGPRIFDGTQSTLLAPGAIDFIFRSESSGDLSAFSTSSVVATYTKDEYIVSDGVQTIAIDIRTRRVRDVGIALSAAFYSEETNQITGTLSSKLVEIEKPATYTDNGTAIPLIVESGHITLDRQAKSLLQYIIIDISTNNETITATLLHDASTTTLGSFTTSFRSKQIITVGKLGYKFGLRLTASLSAAYVYLYGIEFIYAKPKGANQ